jgi:hypothetical protein
MHVASTASREIASENVLDRLDDSCAIFVEVGAMQPFISSGNLDAEQTPIVGVIRGSHGRPGCPAHSNQDEDHTETLHRESISLLAVSNRYKTEI